MLIEKKHSLLTFLVKHYFSCVAGNIEVPAFVPSKTEAQLTWSGFESNVHILLYYIALSSEQQIPPGDCRRYVSTY